MVISAELKEFTEYKPSNLKNKTDLKWSTIKLSEVLERNLRFEASVYGVEGKHAREVLKYCKFSKKPLWGEDGFIKECFYPGRFKRIYVGKQGEDFYLPSQLNEIYPKPQKFISKETKTDIEKLKLKKNSILLTRSGTIGNLTFVSDTLKGKIFSDDVIRIRTKDEPDTGFIYAYLKTNTGQNLIKTNNYGAVVSHIEPEHLREIEVPNPTIEIRKQISKVIVKSFELRDESNELINKSEKLLIKELKLPPIEELKPKYYDKNSTVKNYSVKLSSLNNRFDGSYHEPIINSIFNILKESSKEIKKLGDKKILKDIVLPGRFKRVYVDEGQGTKFLGGKDIFSLDPKTEKYLSIKTHKTKIDSELEIFENSIITPSRGTIGSVVLAPKHFEGWTISDNLIKIQLKENQGFIFSYLNSEYGKIIIKKYIYGGVVDAIETDHFKEIPIPILKNEKVQKEINDLVLKANKLRYEAYLLEKAGINMVNKLVLENSE